MFNPIGFIPGGSGGGAPAPPPPGFSPGDLVGQIRWYKSDAGAQKSNAAGGFVDCSATGDVVARWLDQSPAALHLTAPAGGPPWLLPGRNGKPILQMNLAGNALVGATNFGQTQQFHLFAAVRLTSTASPFPVVNNNNAAQDKGYGLWAHNALSAGAVKHVAYFPAVAWVESAVPVTTNWEIWSLEGLVTTLNTQKNRYFINGEQIQTQNFTAVANDFIGTVATGRFAVEAAPFEIGEVIHYDHTLLDREASRVHEYLISRWL